MSKSTAEIVSMCSNHPRVKSVNGFRLCRYIKNFLMYCFEEIQTCLHHKSFLAIETVNAVHIFSNEDRGLTLANDTDAIVTLQAN